MIWLIVPFSRPEFAQNVMDNYSRQDVPGRLLFVHNSRARQQCHDIVGEHIESEDGLAEPMNAGLKYARKHGSANDWFCKWDDDDWYGEGYLQTVLDGMNKGADFVGRAAMWMRTTTGKLWYITGPQQQFSDDIIPHGPSLAGPIDCPEFPSVDRWGEDAAWAKEMARVGKGNRWLGPARDLCWMRRETGHAFDFSDEAIATLQARPVLDCGLMNESLLHSDLPPPNAQEIRLDDEQAVEAVFSRFP